MPFDFNDFTVYHLPLYPENDTPGAPKYRSSTRQGLQVSAAGTRDSIVGIVNVVWDLNLHTLLRGLCRVITPLSAVFLDTFDLSVSRHLLQTARYTFIWMRATDFSNSCTSTGSQYAVVFTIMSERRYLSLALSFLLLRFSESYTRVGDYNRFKLVNLAYKFMEDGVFGVLFYDRQLAKAFQATRMKACSTDHLDHVLWRGHPICVWNGGEDPFADGSVLRHCAQFYEQTRSIL